MCLSEYGGEFQEMEFEWLVGVVYKQFWRLEGVYILFKV